jgi:hypothetical protein
VRNFELVKIPKEHIKRGIIKRQQTDADHQDFLDIKREIALSLICIKW